MSIAVIKTGGKQYVVSPGKKLKIEKIATEPGQTVQFETLLKANEKGSTELGKPYVVNKVEATVKTHGRGRKISVIKFKRKTRYRKKQGHRQEYTEVEITKI